MGLSMCGHLLAKGLPVTVYSRTKAKAKALLEKGAVWANSPKEVAANSDIVFTMVGYPEDVRAVYLDKNGLIHGVRSGSILVDMTTTKPSLAKDIYDAFGSLNVSTLDCPVSGGDVGAKTAALSIMVGGDKDKLDPVLPYLNLMGKTIVYQGGAGSGQHTKMCNQIVIASTMIGCCESLLYAHRAGLDCETMLQSITVGAAGCWTLNNLAPRIIKKNFDPGFFVDHFVKDMGIALDECRRMKLALPGLALAHQLYTAVQAQGNGSKGTHALFLALERLSSAI